MAQMIRAAVSLFAVWLILVGALIAGGTDAAPYYAVGGLVLAGIVTRKTGGTR